MYWISHLLFPSLLSKAATLESIFNRRVLVPLGYLTRQKQPDSPFSYYKYSYF